MATPTTHASRRKPTPSPTDEVTLTMTRAEAVALQKVADTGVRVIDALHLVQSTGAARKVLDRLGMAISRR